MNWSTIETKWDDYKGDAHKQWSKLTKEQIQGTMGNRVQLSARVQQAYAMTDADAERQISEWQKRQMDKPAGAAKS
jgi:uncharacterized protein YjbJ (UPF0337 family)